MKTVLKVFIVMVLLFTVTAIWSKGGKVEAAPPPEAPVAEGEYREAPMLAARVAAGELPPVDERLPEKPYVVTYGKEIGQYGGTITVASINERKYGDM